MLLPAVIKTIYKDRANTLAYILEPIAPGLKPDAADAEKAGNEVYEWLKSVGVPEKLSDEGFTKDDVEKLTNLVFTTPSLAGLIDIGPSGNSKDVVREIYENSI